MAAHGDCALFGLAIADRHNDAAAAAVAALRAAGLRAEVDDRTESVGRKIRDAELAKVPLMIVVGEREQADGTASVRSHDRGDLGALVPAEIPALIENEKEGTRNAGRG